ncbi:hypothetical protein BCR42DRAFT_426469 [Absidia repens]|uniref:F-box domain-containing protein n=1 Tax=Absidia repens TaxID=90262 RepID=A0A1X2I1B5_9FUNG|nr:hypothetical protein BCR42DRAFT_426469 [Absidia repens]
MINLGEFPVEIISLIVKNVDEDDLYTCALVNKLFYETANPLLWQTPNVDHESVFTQVITGMLHSSSQKLGQYIQHLEFGFPITEALFLLFMKHTPNVEKLAIHIGEYISDTTFEHLPRLCPQLTCIHIRYGSITPQSINTIAQHYPKLEGLQLVDCDRLTPRGGCFGTLFKACPLLEELYIDVGAMDGMDDGYLGGGSRLNTPLVDQFLSELALLKDVKRLTFRECPAYFSKQLLIQISNPQKVRWSNLELFCLERCNNINNKIAIDFIKTHPELKQLVFQTSRFTDAVLDAMVKYLPGLLSMDVSNNLTITPKGVRQFIRQCPQLKCMIVQACSLKFKDFPEADEDICLDEEAELDDDDIPMYLLQLDPDSLDQIRRGPRPAKKRK